MSFANTSPQLGVYEDLHLARIRTMPDILTKLSSEKPVTALFQSSITKFLD